MILFNNILFFFFRSDTVIQVWIRRTLIVKEMILTFRDESILKKRIEIIAINERGLEEIADDLDGVYRDILSAFWSEIMKASFTGETEMVPIIRHDIDDADWKAVCRILLKGLKDINYFPLKLCKAFVQAAFFGSQGITDEDLIERSNDRSNSGPPT